MKVPVFAAWWYVCLCVVLSIVTFLLGMQWLSGYAAGCAFIMAAVNWTEPNTWRAPKSQTTPPAVNNGET